MEEAQEISAFLARGKDHRSSFEEKLFAKSRLIAMTKACVRVGSLHAAPPQWLRYVPPGTTPVMPKKGTSCDSPATFSARAGAWVDGRMVVRCRSMQALYLRSHWYCFRAAGGIWSSSMNRAALRQPQPSEKVTWIPGTTLLLAEKHVGVFPHVLRDLTFANRLLALKNFSIDRVFFGDWRDRLQEWSQHALRAVLGERMCRRIIFSRPAGVSVHPSRLAISNRTLPADNAVWCFEGLVTKYLTYSSDERDVARLREAVYAYCRVPQDKEPSYLLVESRSREPWDRATTRRWANLQEMLDVLRPWAATHRMSVRVVTFSDLSFCGQVHVVSSARVFLGVHGAGLTNSVFMRDGQLLIEILRRSWSYEQEGLAYQPLRLMSNQPYLAIRAVDSTCASENFAREKGNWKFRPKCLSLVNVSRLAAELRHLVP